MMRAFRECFCAQIPKPNEAILEDPLNNSEKRRSVEALMKLNQNGNHRLPFRIQKDCASPNQKQEVTRPGEFFNLGAESKGNLDIPSKKRSSISSIDPLTRTKMTPTIQEKEELEAGELNSEGKEEKDSDMNFSKALDNAQRGKKNSKKDKNCPDHSPDLQSPGQMKDRWVFDGSPRMNNLENMDLEPIKENESNESNDSLKDNSLRVQSGRSLNQNKRASSIQAFSANDCIIPKSPNLYQSEQRVSRANYTCQRLKHKRDLNQEDGGDLTPKRFQGSSNSNQFLQESPRLKKTNQKKSTSHYVLPCESPKGIQLLSVPFYTGQVYVSERNHSGGESQVSKRN